MTSKIHKIAWEQQPDESGGDHDYWLECEKSDQRYDNSEVTGDWNFVTCKNCLKRKPTQEQASAKT